MREEKRRDFQEREYSISTESNKERRDKIDGECEKRERKQKM